MKTIPIWGLGRLAIPMALAVMALGACTKKEVPSAVVRPVRSIVVEKREVGDPKVVSGHLRARNEVNLAFRIGGRIIQRKVGVGDMVQARQTVPRREPPLTNRKHLNGVSRSCLPRG